MPINEHFFLPFPAYRYFRRTKAPLVFDILLILEDIPLLATFHAPKWIEDPGKSYYFFLKKGGFASRQLIH